MDRREILSRNLEALKGAPIGNQAFANAALRFSRDELIQLVEMAGFVGANRVLDAGCGYGQFACALAARNREVIACDRSSAMLEVGRHLARAWNANNVTFQ